MGQGDAQRFTASDFPLAHANQRGVGPHLGALGQDRRQIRVGDSTSPILAAEFRLRPIGANSGQSLEGRQCFLERQVLITV